MTTHADTAAACQILYAAADLADAPLRARIFRAIQRLTGKSLQLITRTWESTR